MKLTEKYKKHLFVTSLVIFFIVVIVLNNWIDKEARSLGLFKILSSTYKGKNVNSEETSVVSYTEVLRKSRLDPSRKYAQNIFFEKGKEIARFKSVGEIIGEKIYDYQGTIPDGAVKFIDQTRNSYGVEHYKNGKRDGKYIEYYKNGATKKEILFEEGQIKKLKELFIDGKTRMEVDYSDALRFTKDSEVGVGKIYYRDGVLMYEWNLTNSNKDRFKKAYNINGALLEERTYDISGNLIEKKEYPRQ